MSKMPGEVPFITPQTARPRLTMHWDEYSIMAALGLVLVVLVAVGANGLPLPLAALRLLLSLAFLLFAPGYAVQAAAFPPPGANGGLSHDRLDWVERLALSFGLSLAVDAAIALLLDRLPWGIHPWTIIVSIAAVTASAMVVTWYRRRRLSYRGPWLPTETLDLRRHWQAQSRRTQVLYCVLGLAGILSLTAAGTIMISKPPSAYYSEFYILGSDGLAERYPYTTTIGRPVTVTLGIVNREGVSVAYRTEVRDNGILVGSGPTLQLRPGVKQEIPLQFTPVNTGEDVPITFLLYRDGAKAPYRTLRLWLQVKAVP